MAKEPCTRREKPSDWGGISQKVPFNLREKMIDLPNIKNSSSRTVQAQKRREKGHKKNTGKELSLQEHPEIQGGKNVNRES